MPRAGGTPLGGHSSGGYPAAPAPTRSLADSRVLWIGLAIVALIAVIVIVVALAGGGGDEAGGSAATSGDGGGSAGGEPSGYTQEIEDTFTESCTSTGGTDPQCACAWDAIVEQIPYERFVEIEQQIADGSAADSFDELGSILSDCVGAA